jgi:hypothetical protein
MASIFDIIKRITTTKDDWKDIPEDERNAFNNWMCNRILSMDPDYCEVVNFVQKNTWQMKGEYLYNLYKDLIPKQYKYLKYIKPSKKKEYDASEVEAVVTYFEISKKEAKQYIDMLPKDVLNNIISQINGKGS